MNTFTKQIRKDGYVNIRVNGKRWLEHRYIAEMYIPNPENKPCVNHKDGNRSNNNLDNLEWVTYSENHKHAFRVLKRKLGGRAVKMVNGELKGEDCWNSKLSNEAVQDIRTSTLTGVELAKKYNVSRSLISQVKNKKRWI